MTVGNSDSMPVSRAASIILFIALPIKQTDLPAASPASAIDLILAILLAKVVVTTMLEHASISLRISGPTSDSERPTLSEKTLVLSHISARTPVELTSCHNSLLKRSPTTGCSSSLKSPVWINLPFGLSITKALLSGTECGTGKYETLNGPTFIDSGQDETTFTILPLCPFSSNFRFAMLAVKVLAYTGAPSSFQR